MVNTIKCELPSHWPTVNSCVKKDKKRDKKQIKEEPKAEVRVTPAVPTVSGFESGLEVEKIIGAIYEHSELMFLIKWYVFQQKHGR